MKRFFSKIIIVAAMLAAITINADAAKKSKSPIIGFMEKYEKQENALYMKISGGLLALTRMAAESDEEKEFMKSLKMMCIFSMEECSEAGRTEAMTSLNGIMEQEGGYEMLVEANDEGEKVIIWCRKSKDSDEGKISEFIMVVPEKMSIIYMQGEFSLEMAKMMAEE